MRQNEVLIDKNTHLNELELGLNVPEYHLNALERGLYALEYHLNTQE